MLKNFKAYWLIHVIYTLYRCDEKQQVFIKELWKMPGYIRYKMGFAFS